jgi:hypothetical protein
VAKNERALWDLGNISTSRPLQLSPLRVPAEVELEGDNVIWRDIQTNLVWPGPGVLEQFIELHALDDEAILTYARKYGSLGICTHDVPSSHADGYCRSMFYAPSLSRYCFPMTSVMPQSKLDIFRDVCSDRPWHWQYSSTTQCVEDWRR